MLGFIKISSLKIKKQPAENSSVQVLIIYSAQYVIDGVFLACFTLQIIILFSIKNDDLSMTFHHPSADINTHDYV